MLDSSYIIGHGIHAIFGLVLIISAYIAIKKFRIVVWKKGWYLIMAGGVFVIFFAVFELLGFNPHENILYHIIESSSTYGLISIGTLILAETALKLWGK